MIYFLRIENGSELAGGRAAVAILENYQQIGGSVKMPEVLQGFIGADKIMNIRASFGVQNESGSYLNLQM